MLLGKRVSNEKDEMIDLGNMERDETTSPATLMEQSTNF